MLSPEDKAEIAEVVAAAIEKDRQDQRERRMEMSAQEARDSPKVTKLYLVTLTGHQLAFPDAAGRAVLNQCIYARITMQEKDPHFYAGGRVEVLAYGDGRRLPEPLTLILTGGGVVGLVEVSEDILKP